MIFCQLGGQGEPPREGESLSEGFVHRQQMQHLQHGLDPQSVLTVPSRGSKHSYFPPPRPERTKSIFQAQILSLEGNQSQLNCSSTQQEDAQPGGSGWVGAQEAKKQLCCRTNLLLLLPGFCHIMCEMSVLFLSDKIDGF